MAILNIAPRLGSKKECVLCHKVTDLREGYVVVAERYYCLGCWPPKKNTLPDGEIQVNETRSSEDWHAHRYR